MTSKYMSIERDAHGLEYIRCSTDEAIIVAVDGSDVLLIIEPAPAFGGETLILPGGSVDEGEHHGLTANRELQEEIGYKAQRLEFLGELRPWSKYLALRTYVYLGRDLVQSRLSGDEDYSIRVERVNLATFERLIVTTRLQDARVIAALYMARAALS